MKRLILKNITRTANENQFEKRAFTNKNLRFLQAAIYLAKKMAARLGRCKILQRALPQTEKLVKKDKTKLNSGSKNLPALSYTTFVKSDSAQWVTFVHGAGGSSSIWYKQIRDFKKEFNVLLIDLRGHGKSKREIYENLKKYTFDVIGDEVIEVMNHENIRSSHFVGISLGTIIIREISERYPDRVSSMILGGAVMKLNLRGQILMRTGALLKSVIPYLLLYRFFAFIIMPRKKHRDSRNLFIREAKKLYQKEFKRWFTLISQVNPLLAMFRIKESLVPTLYIMGSEDHMFLPSITKLVKNHSTAELTVVQDSGHVVNVEKPEIFNSRSISFIRALES